MRKLREYQEQAKAAVRQAYIDGLYRVGVGLPTGTGKTDIFSSMAQGVYAGGKRVIILVHRDTLVNQAVERLQLYVPEHAIGIVKAAKDEVEAPVIVASVQTLSRVGRLARITPPDLTVVDEAHVSVSPTYHRYYQHVGAVPGGRGRLVGFTATWMRSDKTGLGDIWERVVYRRSIRWAVRNGFLVEPQGLQIGDALDLSGVRIIKDQESEHYGDYNERDLQDVVMVDDLLETVIRGYHEHAPGESAVAFFPTQASARYFAAGFTDGLGGKYPPVKVGEILASTTRAQREWNFSCFSSGATKILVTCTALAEGWDAPKCGVMICVRPTKSLLMFVQQVGRVLRPWPGKRRGLVLDAVGVTDDKSLASVVDLSVTPEPAVQVPGDEDPDELDDFERAPAEPRTARRIHGVQEVDLFAGTNARWLLTEHGVPFVSTRDHTYFVAQHEGMWAVGRCGARSIQGGAWMATGLSSDVALEIGSDLALEEDPSIADKRAAWRSQAQPTQQQIDFARQLGISYSGQRRSELSDQISIKLASRLLSSIKGA